MKTELEDEDPIAWTAILANTRAFSTDQEEVGAVRDVVGAEDIFHGLVISHGTLGHEVLIPAEDVGAITKRRIELKLSAEEVRNLPPYKAEAVFELGMVGLLRKHLGWVKSDEPERPAGG